MTGSRASGDRSEGSAAWVSTLAVVLLLVALAAAALLAWREWKTFGNEYTHADEIFFAVCAARGSSVGDFPPPGCHDNKAPLIYLIYQAVQAASGTYSLTGIKLVGQSLVVLALIAVAALAYRAEGRSAALFSMVLAAQVFGIHHELLALKTEVIGTLFLLAGTWVLIRWQARRRLIALFSAGLLFGVALMLKQTFAFGVLAAWLWIALICDIGEGHSLFRRLWACVVFGLGVGVPLATLGIVFWSRGQGLDFLGAVFLHAAAYGVSSEAATASSRIWRFVWFIHFIGLGLPLVLAFGASLSHWLRAAGPRAITRTLAWREMGLFYLLAMGSMLVPLLAKQSFQSHLLPVWLLMSVPAGAALARWLETLSGDGSLVRSQRLVICTIGLMFSLWMAGNSLHSNGDPIRREAVKHHALDAASRIPEARGSYGYVLGVRPEFYFFNGIIPASDVLYPGPLRSEGTSLPTSSQGQGNGWRDRAWLSLRLHAEERLKDDFSKTPPRYVFLVDEHSRRPGSDSVSDVAVIRDYVNSHCKMLRSVEGKPYQTGRLYECAAPQAGASSQRV